MDLTLTLVDAFAAEPGQGNQAAVCLLEKEVAAPWMQEVANELNFSETAFLQATSQADRYGLRWFTPKTEVQLCGHATLASAHFLWSTGAASHLTFETAIGRLECDLVERHDPQSTRGLLQLPCPKLGVPSLDVSLQKILSFSGEVMQAGEDLLVELASAEAVKVCRPNLAALAEVPVRGLMITARSEQGDVDFVSRFFAPRVGIYEDPATGSAQAALAGYWSPKLNKEWMQARQLSDRGGSFEVRQLGDQAELIGRSHSRGTILLRTSCGAR